MFKVLLPRILFLLLFVFTFPLFSSVVFAQSAAERYQEIQKKIDETTAKINDLQKTEKDLKSQIAYFDNQIKLTELKIEQAEATITQLEKEIGVLGFRIGYISESVGRLETLLKQRIVATYEQSFVSNLEMLFASNDFSDLILRVQYVRQVQENDKKLLANLQETRSSYANQKDEREDKQAQIEEAKKKLDDSKSLLASQKKEKDDFLVLTKNDRSRYGAILAQLKAEREAVNKLLGGQGIKLGPVKKGESIGSVGGGLIGCSKGPHLHFEVRVDGGAVNPASYLDSNQFAKPTSGYPGNVHQGFGENANQLFYGAQGHTGIDMGTVGDTVYAAENGEASYVVDQAPCVRGGVPGRQIIVDHGSGIKTLYLHVL